MGFFKKLIGGEHERSHGSRHGGSYDNSHGGHHGGSSHHQNSGRPLDNTWGASTTTATAGAVTLVACSSCNVANEASSRFCKQCGKSLVISTCKGCNSALKPDAKFCDQCGVAR